MERRLEREGRAMRMPGRILAVVLLLAAAVAGCTGDREPAQSRPSSGELKWVPVRFEGVYGSLSTAIWAPSDRIRRGSIFNAVLMVRNDSEKDLQVPQDILGRFALEVELDGEVQRPLNTFEYRGVTDGPDWTLRPGDVLMRPLPIFTGDADKRFRTLEGLDSLPMDEDVILVGVHAGNAADVKVRLGLMTSTNSLAAGTSQARFHVSR